MYCSSASPLRYQVALDLQYASQKELVTEDYLLCPHCDFPAFRGKSFRVKAFRGIFFVVTHFVEILQWCNSEMVDGEMV